MKGGWGGSANVNFLFVLRVASEKEIQEKKDKVWDMRRAITSEENMNIRFEVDFSYEGFLTDSSISRTSFGGITDNKKEFKDGLSFTMCKKLVQMMQGNIWMSSDSRGHATMSLVLKFLKLSSFRRQALEFGIPSRQSTSSVSFKGLQVIVADDDDVNRVVTRKLLEKLGCQVTTVSSGLQCLSALGPSSTNYQIVVLDLNMPEMDGFEVAARIRKFRSHNWPLIVALTTSTEELVWERCLQVGMNGLIKKPILLQGMADELRPILQRAGDGL